ncbi:hypothetical protein ALI144C_22735 [Actinosynnema sp. ALI-1.44]|uniref:cytochrome P450 n=1 Tax=Actinosynnema sp. ALI-1.44 TaxID=1933779 RepID=UPI00097C8FAC|nr:cytochrome P450 [Actinosynnema sp. ALI-1.44]ONI79604.1 hypothetical protein ALI144C_22735 [Actinosynnema sp. ALI-1.44]
MLRSARDELRALLAYRKEIQAYDRDRLGYIQKRRKADGKNFRLDDYEVVITDGPSAKKILADTNRTNFVNPDLYAARCPLDAAKQYTSDWMPARHNALQHMKRRRAAEHATAVEEAFASYLRTVEGSRVDVTEVLKMASGQVMAELTFGRHGSQVAEMVRTSVHANLPIMNSSQVLPGWLPLPRVRRQRRRSRALRARVDEIVTNRQGSGKTESENLLDAIANGTGASRKQVVDAVQVCLLASFGVPGAALSWSLAMLERDDEFAAMARKEAIGAPITSNILEDAPIITAMVYEVLRLYPPAWLIARVAGSEIRLPDLTVAPETTINIILFSIHRDAKEWDMADSFEPRRWLEANGMRKGIFLPFGAGPRVCIGSHLGMIEIVTMLIVFLRAHRLTTVELDATPDVRTLLVPRHFEAGITKLG